MFTFSVLACAARLFHSMLCAYEAKSRFDDGRKRAVTTQGPDQAPDRWRLAALCLLPSMLIFPPFKRTSARK